jgi:hypothetical protein
MFVGDTDFHDNYFEKRLYSWSAPTLLYTVVPQDAAGRVMNTSFGFIDNDFVSYVDGGAKYRHKLWNYNGDWVRTNGWLGYTIFSIDRKRVDPLHELVLLTPIKWVFAPLANLWSGQHLDRWNVAVTTETDKWTVFNSGEDVTIAQQNDVTPNFLCARIPLSADAGLRALRSSQKSELGSYQIMTMTKFKVTDPKDVAMCAIATAYYRAAVPPSDIYVHPIDKSVRRYQMLYRPYEVNARPSMFAWCSPLVDAAYAPDSCLSNDVAFAQDRVIKLDQRDKFIDCGKALRMETIMAEFISHFPKHTLHPLDLDDIYTRQHRPTQRHILDKARNAVGKLKYLVKSFMKRESYSNVKDPRCISTIEPQSKLHWSRYVYALADLLKTDSDKYHWYAFGKTPLEIARAVARLCMRAKSHVGETDCSRMDGRIATMARKLERGLMLHLFPPEYHEEIIKYMESQHHVNCITKFAYFYASWWCRLSGSPETSAFNTILNAFMAYAAGRIQFPNLSPKELWNWLGQYGGDDGVSADIKPEIYASVAETCGQLLTYEKIMRGEQGVNFLSRFYSKDVWTGDVNSMCDLRRQLSKWHVSTHDTKLHAPGDIGLGKATGYILTDPNTPILGRLSLLTLKCFGTGSAVVSNDQGKHMSWWAQFDESVQFPNDVGDWGIDHIKMYFPEFNMDRFNQHMCAIENELAEGNLAGARVKLINLPLCVDTQPPIVKVEAVVNGELFGSEPSVEIPQDEASRLDFKDRSTGQGERCWYCNKTDHSASDCRTIKKKKKNGTWVEKCHSDPREPKGKRKK